MTDNEIKLDNGPCCCCCFSETELLSMLEPQHLDGETEVYTSMITNCYGIEMKIGAEDIYKELLMICKICISHLRSAFQFKHQVQNAYDRIQNYVYSLSRVKIKKNVTHITSDRDSSENETVENFRFPLGIKTEYESDQEDNWNPNKPLDIPHSCVWIKPESSMIKNKEEKPKQSQYLLSKTDLTCKMCSQNFPKHKMLKEHMAEHFPNYDCDICHRKFAIKSNFQRHVRHHKEMRISRKCHVCNKIVKGRSCRRHLKTHDAQKASSTIPEEMSIEQEDTILNSSDHYENFKDKKQTKKLEELQIDENDLTCKICNETFTWHRSLKIHMAVHFPNYICHICSKGFVRRPSLRAHLQNHEDIKTTLTCNICNKIIQGAEKLRRHMKTHDDPTSKYKCPKCPERFVNFFQRTTHLINVHNDETKIRRCKYCNKGFKSKGNLKGHIDSVHLKVKNFACEVCSMMFFSKKELENHMYCHTDKKDFHCDVCKKSFARKKALTEHMKIHNNIKKFSCNICNRAFTQKCTLKGHMKTHNKCENGTDNKIEAV